MNTSEIVAALDAEIARLEHVRAIIASTSGSSIAKAGKQRGRPAESKSVAPKRVLSPEARKKIGDAQRKRWAAQKKQS